MKIKNIRYLKGIGPRKEIAFNAIKIFTTRDLLYYFPQRYEDRSQIRNICECREDEMSLIRGKVLTKKLKSLRFVKKRMGRKIPDSIFEIVLGDSTGYIPCVWFNQSYLDKLIFVGTQLILFGKLKRYQGKMQMVSPEFEIINRREGDSFNFGRIVSFYRLSKGLSQAVIRKALHSLLSDRSNHIEESIPEYLLKEKNLPSRAKSFYEIHFPSTYENAMRARQRFIFEELFYSQILVYLRKAKHCLQKGLPVVINDEIRNRIISNIPFQLTSAQEHAVGQIIESLKKPYPMHRLLQGDVGSGKTVVACFAIAFVAANRYQVAFMVPTEVLARQHYVTLQDILTGFSFRIELYISAISPREKKGIVDRLAAGQIDIIIGTHSLIEEAVQFKNLGLVVIDEQHKFGVAQRALLPKKREKISPHCLVMSATPIPRSLALSLYGDLDLSIIKELPPGRHPPQTIWLKEKDRDKAYALLRKNIKEGRQGYIVFPLIEESEDEELHSLNQMKDAIAQEFSEFSVGVFHGKMKPKLKKEVITAFKENKLNLLIATTVIEVGVNIENATTMIVENPERFGLAQLHQLRGRIQRARYQPYFVLVSSNELSENAQKRLQIISTTYDGFSIAEEDLKLRGPGDFFGNIQSGLPQLKIADPLKDLQILSEARRSAYTIIKRDPSLRSTLHQCIKSNLEMWLTK